MGDIGNKAVLDVLRLKTIPENPKMSFYNLISDLLGENKFDFFPLPTFTNFTNTGDPEKIAEEMFSPYTNTIPKNSGPNFICMYVGGTSRVLDLKPKTNCYIDQKDMNYNNDGFGLLNSEFDSDVPYEFSNADEPNEFKDKNRIENLGSVAFRVAYGLENQNMFKSVQLDQTEFSETNESLMVIDRLANGGDPSNRTQKGNNLHNIYLTRSYTCTVESLGNMMIQPLQYFDLTNIPMFHGTYLITKVSHNVKPHHINTSFTGVRQPIATVPVVEDVATAFNASLKDIEPIPGGAGFGTGGSGSSGRGGSGYLIMIKKTNNKYWGGVDLLQGQSINNPNGFIFDYYKILNGQITEKSITEVLGSKFPNQNKLTDLAIKQNDLWGGSSIKENNPQILPTLKEYAEFTPGFSAESYASDKTPWSAIFVSYLMGKIDNQFKRGTSHKQYIDSSMKGENGYEVFPLMDGLKIKVDVGDVFCADRSGGVGASHCDVVYKIDDDVAYLIGGNLGNTVKSNLKIKLLNGEYSPTSTNGGANITECPNTEGKRKISNKVVDSKKAKEIGKKIFPELSNKALSGLLGHLQHESNLNPTAYNSSGGGCGAYGIAQWRGERFKNLEKFAIEKNKSIDDFELQLEFVKKEMESVYNKVFNLLKNNNLTIMQYTAISHISYGLGSYDPNGYYNNIENNINVYENEYIKRGGKTPNSVPKRFQNATKLSQV